MRALLRLRELILSGEFEPGERMSELPLVERLGVSRTPLRLALASLEHEGLLSGLSGGLSRYLGSVIANTLISPFVAATWTSMYFLLRAQHEEPAPIAAGAAFNE